MSERVEHLGQRVELRQQKRRLTAEVEALRDKLRRALPAHEEAETLKGEEILDTAIALKTSLDELTAVERKIAILTRELGD